MPQKMLGQGLILEFGVWSGKTINMIADYVGPSRQVHGFDSFEGLPEDWFGQFTKGRFHTQGKLPEVRSNVQLHVGWFDKTLPDFAAEHRENIAFLHVDCDLYSSTKTIFDLLGDRLVPGSVILFDEYFNYPGWREHEHRAFQELVQERSLKYRWIAYNRVEWNAAVQIID
jgi:Macrocin-O-methyltransferase (TylF)